MPPLEKLSLTSTIITSTELLGLLRALSHESQLKILSLAALGIRQGSISNSTAMTLTDTVLRELTDILANFPYLESVNLLGNVKLGTTAKLDSPLEYFITRVGRRCKARKYSYQPWCTY